MILRPRSNWILIIAAVLIIAGVTLILLRGDEDGWAKDSSGQWVKHGNPEIQDFESCAKKYPVMETFPEQCAMPDGPTFSKKIDIINLGGE